MTPFVGEVPGFSYEILPGSQSQCSICKRDSSLVLRTGAQTSVCEPCSMLLAWAWRDYEGVSASRSAYPSTIGFVLVLIVRERENDFMSPFDVFMAERQDEPGAFGLPGGKVERGETPAQAAARCLAETAEIETWTSALEPLHTGYSPRARLGTVFLCRGYDGTPEDRVGPEGQRLAWKPWPPGQHARHAVGYYEGVAQAFDIRWRMHRQAQATTPLSLQLGEPAVSYLKRRFAQLRGQRRPDDARMLDVYTSVMSVAEVQICNLIVNAETKASAAIVAPARQRPPVEEPSEDAEEEEFEEVKDGIIETALTEDGFLRPPPPQRPSR